jgi:hypothetical protein
VETHCKCCSCSAGLGQSAAGLAAWHSIGRHSLHSLHKSFLHLHSVLATDCSDTRDKRSSDRLTTVIDTDSPNLYSCIFLPLAALLHLLALSLTPCQQRMGREARPAGTSPSTRAAAMLGTMLRRTGIKLGNTPHALGAKLGSGRPIQDRILRQLTRVCYHWTPRYGAHCPHCTLDTNPTAHTARLAAIAHSNGCLQKKIKSAIRHQDWSLKYSLVVTLLP